MLWVVMSMKKGKTCGEDHLVVDMLQSLELEFFDLLAKIFSVRLTNPNSEDFETARSANVIAFCCAWLARTCHRSEGRTSNASLTSPSPCTHTLP